MNGLVVRPVRRTLEYSLFDMATRAPLASDRIDDFRGSQSDRVSAVDAFRHIQAVWRRTVGPTPPTFIATRVPYGGDRFTGPEVVADDTLVALEALAHEAPLHIPMLIRLIEGCRRVFPSTPVVLLFENAFFETLPARERVYGLDPDLMEGLGLRRRGFHGLYHAAACAEAAAVWNRRCREGKSPRPNDRTRARIVSICLEHRPEATAVIGHRPVMVTSGVTPLEGLPGRRTCGEIDPAIVLSLANELGWGPEKINEVLTQESGIQGLLDGNPVELDALLLEEPSTRERATVRDFMRYRLLLACGAAAAAMGGIDLFAFSGRYVNIARSLGPWLAERLRSRSPWTPATAIECVQFEESLERIMADLAVAVLLNRGKTGASSPPSSRGSVAVPLADESDVAVLCPAASPDEPASAKAG